MPKFSISPKAGFARDMTAIRWSAILDHDRASGQVTSLRLFDSGTDFALLGGTGLTYSGTGLGGLKSGTITSLRIVEAGVTLFEATGLAVPAAGLAQAFRSFNDLSFGRLLLGGNDLVQGNHRT